MDHKWGRTAAEIGASWTTMPGMLNRTIPATLASRIQSGPFADWYLLNVTNTGAAVLQKFNAVMQVWEVGQTFFWSPLIGHFPFGIDVEPDGPV